MKKAELIAELNLIRSEAAKMKEVALQNYNLAARLESSAEVRLEGLGNPDGRRRKAKFELSEKQKLDLVASLTAGAKPNT